MGDTKGRGSVTGAGNSTFAAQAGEGPGDGRNEGVEQPSTTTPDHAVPTREEDRRPDKEATEPIEAPGKAREEGPVEGTDSPYHESIEGDIED